MNHGAGSATDHHMARAGGPVEFLVLPWTFGVCRAGRRNFVGLGRACSVHESETPMCRVCRLRCLGRDASWREGEWALLRGRPDAQSPCQARTRCAPTGIPRNWIFILRIHIIIQWTKLEPRSGNPAAAHAARALPPPLPSVGGGSSLWPQKGWELPDRAVEGAWAEAGVGPTGWVWGVRGGWGWAGSRAGGTGAPCGPVPA